MTSVTTRQTDETPTRAIALLAVAAFASAANLRVCDPLLPQIADQLGVTVGAAAGMVTAFAIAYGVSQLAVGPIGDARGKLPMVVLGSVLTGLATMLCAAMPTLGSLMVARFVAGACAAAVIPLAMAWIGDVDPLRAAPADPGALSFGADPGCRIRPGGRRTARRLDRLARRHASTGRGARGGRRAAVHRPAPRAVPAHHLRPHALGRRPGFRHRDGAGGPGCASCSSRCSSRAW